MTSTQKIVVASVLGAAAGATAGILFAPDKGKKTRKKIARKFEDLKDSVEELVEDGKDYVKSFSTNGSVKQTA